MDIRTDDLSGDETRALVALHLAGMAESSPEAFRFALDLSGLTVPEVTVWSAWIEGHVAAIGALKMFGDGVGEVKSMRTHPDFTGRGAGAAILATIIETARLRGLTQLSLETGTAPSFDAATRLYCRYGFESGPPFGPYKATPHNRFFHLSL